MKNTFDHFYAAEFCLSQSQTLTENQLTAMEKTEKKLQPSWNNYGSEFLPAVWLTDQWLFIAVKGDIAHYMKTKRLCTFPLKWCMLNRSLLTKL